MGWDIKRGDMDLLLTVDVKPCLSKMREGKDPPALDFRHRRIQRLSTDIRSIPLHIHLTSSYRLANL